jgi:phasin family protein
MTATKKTIATVDQVEAGSEAYRKYQDFVALGHDNVAAVFNSGAVLAKGLRDFNEMWLGLAQASVRDGVAAAQAVLDCASVPEALGVHIDLVKTNTTKVVAENRKMTDMSTRLAQDAMEPLAKRVTATVEKFAKPLSI